MPNTYSQLYVQIVFAVKGRHGFINESFREELQKYIAGIISAKKQKLYAIYCMPDHVHIFVSMSPAIAISDLVRDIKANSSSFVRERNWVRGQFSWQEGFGAFTYHISQAKVIVDYILGQPEHHHQQSFREEYLKLLNEFEINFDNKYLFEFYED